jgi:hypothetical protein
MLWLPFLLGCVSSWSPQDVDGDGFSALEGDCDEGDAARNPKADEACDGVDDDCDGVIDEGVTTLRYPDVDGDSFGDEAAAQATCGPVEGLITDGGDCDDADANASPIGQETCNERDDDCDGTVDEDPVSGGTTWYRDEDGDTYGGEAVVACIPFNGAVSQGGDCDDSDPAIYPGAEATDLPGDGIDPDCDGIDGCADLDCDGRTDLLLSYVDDGDGGPGARAYGQTDRDLYRIADIAAPVALASASGDFDGDGDMDVAFAGSGESSRVVWSVDAGLGAGSRVDLPTRGARDLVAVDLNEDAVLDLVFAEAGLPGVPAGESQIFWGGVSGIDPGTATALTTYGAVDLLVADLDANGRPDLAFCNALARGAEDEASPIYWGESGAIYVAGRVTSLPTQSCAALLADDIDGDGLLDLVVGQSGPAWLWSNDGDRFVGAVPIDLPLTDAAHLRAGDVNGDGHIDVLGARLPEGDLSTLPAADFSALATLAWGSADGGFLAETLGAPGALHPEVVDLDGDGFDDIVVPGFAQATADGDTRSPGSTLYWGSAEGLITGVPLLTENARWVSVGDIDGDRFLDLVFVGLLNDSGAPPNGHIFWGDSAGYSSSNRIPIDPGFAAGPPLLVGLDL